MSTVRLVDRWNRHLGRPVALFPFRGAIRFDNIEPAGAETCQVLLGLFNQLPSIPSLGASPSTRWPDSVNVRAFSLVRLTEPRGGSAACEESALKRRFSWSSIRFRRLPLYGPARSSPGCSTGQEVSLDMPGGKEWLHVSRRAVRQEPRGKECGQ